jgi:sugar O-acyltransferase (sialic acid O-acetyltransferase NeuD family)
MPLNKSQWNPLMETAKFILIGGGGHARVVSSIIEAQENSHLEVVFDSNSKIETLDGVENFHKYNPDQFPNALAIVAIGDNKIRKQLAQTIQHVFGKLIHPSASIDRLGLVGEGSVVLHHAVIQRGTRIGKHGIINTASSVDHDCVLGDFVHIAPNATLCGGVQIGDETFIGSGVIVLPEIKIGKQVIVGAGTVVTKNIPDGATVVGNPGKIINSNGAI